MEGSTGFLPRDGSLQEPKGAARGHIFGPHAQRLDDPNEVARYSAVRRVCSPQLPGDSWEPCVNAQEARSHFTMLMGGLYGP